jgi:hypothetical protein
METPTLGDRAFSFVLWNGIGLVLFVLLPITALALLVWLVKSLWLLL